MIVKKLIYIIVGFLLINPLNAQSSSIRVISPNGDERLSSGSRYSISWISDNIDKVNILYSANGGASWVIISNSISGELGSYSWVVPKINTNTLLVKIESNNNSNIFDISDDFIQVENTLQKKISKDLNSLKILPLGNSITFDNRSNDVRPVEDKIGYRYPLYNLLIDDGFNFEFIGSEHAGSNFFSPFIEYDKNAGFPGIKDDQLYELLATGIRNQPQHGYNNDTITIGPYLDTHSPDIILLHIGTNGNNEVGGTNPSDVENILDEIDIYENNSGNEVVVFLARIINRSPNESYVTTFNDNIENMVFDRVNNALNDAFPDKIVMVDMENIPGFNYTISPDPNGSPGDMNDLLHPNDKGYTKIAQSWFNSLKTYLGSPPLIVKQPSSTGVIEGSIANFKVSIESTLPISFQWEKNNVELPGETDSILNISNTSITDDSSSFSCLVSNVLGTISSDSVFLYVTKSTERVTSGLELSYDFNEEFGNKITDKSASDISLDLQIDSLQFISWQPKGLKINGNTRIFSSENTFPKFRNILNSNEISIEMWLKPALGVQQGPARIFTLSKNIFERNFTILQDGDNYEFRLRTTETDNNGIPSLFSSDGQASTNLTHITLTYSKDNFARMYIDGQIESAIYLGGNFSSWDSTYFIGLANEFIDEKPWLGSYQHLSIYNRTLSDTEITHNYNLGIDNLNKNLLPPTNLFLVIDNNTTRLNWNDNSNIESGYIIRRNQNEISNFEILDTVLVSETSYIDSLLSDGTNYKYFVSAFNNFGESTVSNAASIVTELPNPSNLVGIPLSNGDVELNWEDNSVNEDGFIIERRANHPDSIFSVIGNVNKNLVTFTDASPNFVSEYIYRILAFNKNTNSDFSNEISLTVVEVEEKNNTLPKVFSLDQNYPNPFNPSTTISYQVPITSQISVKVFNSLGQIVRILVNKLHPQGYYNLNLNGSNLSSGIYYYKLSAHSLTGKEIFSNTKKIVLIK